MEMMKRGVEVVPPYKYLLGSTASWTRGENKEFERALAELDSDTPDRWQKVALRIPGKTPEDVIAHYHDLVQDVTQIDAGQVPLPGYNNNPSTFTLDWEWESDDAFPAFNHHLHHPHGLGGKRSGHKLSDQERKKGIPWTEDEHRKFLMGLKKYGKGDWRNISRNYVTTRTPTQVASHAQKYFIRLSTGGKDKRRSSIHDITTVNLPDDDKPPSPHPPPTVQRSANFTSGCSSDHHNYNNKMKMEDAMNNANNVSNSYDHLNLLAQSGGGGGGGGGGVAAFSSIMAKNRMLLQLQPACLHPLG